MFINSNKFKNNFKNENKIEKKVKFVRNSEQKFVNKNENKINMIDLSEKISFDSNSEFYSLS